MPGTIFDALAADAARREAEYERMFDAMRGLVKKPARSPKKPTRSRMTRPTRGPVDRCLHVTLVDAQSGELTELERQYVLERDRWLAQLEDLVPIYGQQNLEQGLWWRASRAAAHRLAAVEGLPELARRGQEFTRTTRTALARLVMRKLPGGSTAGALLHAAGAHLTDSPVESFRRWLLDVWSVTDPARLQLFATLPAPRFSKGALFSWAACEVADWLKRCHPEGRFDLGHGLQVLEAGGWTAETRVDPYKVGANVERAIRRERRRRAKRLGSLFNR